MKFADGYNQGFDTQNSAINIRYYLKTYDVNLNLQLAIQNTQLVTRTPSRHSLEKGNPD